MPALECGLETYVASVVADEKEVGSNGFVVCVACVSRTLIACLDALMATFYWQGPMAIDIEARRFDNNCAEGLWKIVIPYATASTQAFRQKCEEARS